MTKPKKQTSSTISSIAGRYVRMRNAAFYELCDEAVHGPDAVGAAFFRDIRKLAASCLSQDESKGQK